MAAAVKASVRAAAITASEKKSFMGASEARGAGGYAMKERFEEEGDNGRVGYRVKGKGYRIGKYS
jgi:hypothetical protein